MPNVAQHLAAWLVAVCVDNVTPPAPSSTGKAARMSTGGSGSAPAFVVDRTYLLKTIERRVTVVGFRRLLTGWQDVNLRATSSLYVGRHRA